MSLVSLSSSEDTAKVSADFLKTSLSLGCFGDLAPRPWHCCTSMARSKTLGMRRASIGQEVLHRDSQGQPKVEALNGAKGDTLKRLRL